MGFLIFGVVAIGLVVALSAASSRRSTHRGRLPGASRWGGAGGTDAGGWGGDFGGGHGGSGGGDSGGGGGGDGGGGGGC